MFGLSPVELIIFITPKLFWAGVILAALFIMNKFVKAYAERTKALKS